MLEDLMIIKRHAEADEADAALRHKRNMERKQEADRKAKEAEEAAYNKMWGWKDEGKKTYREMNHAFAGLQSILVPHKCKKSTMLELDGFCKAAHTNESFLYRRMSQRVLNEISPFHLRYRLKRRAIHRKYIVMREIFNRTRAMECLRSGYYETNNFVYNEFMDEHFALLQMEAAYGRRVLVGPAKIMLLRMLRTRVQDAKDKLDRATQGVEKCEYMLVCTSVYHERLAGCLKCGLIMIHGKMCMESYDRATNASIVVPREFELEILKREVIEFQEKYDEVKSALTQVETELRHKTVYDVQAWWGTRLAIRKAREMNRKMEHSRFYFRIRRLVKLKKALDEFDPWRSSLEALEAKFCDLLPELAEYRLKKTTRAMKIANRFARQILTITREKASAVEAKRRLQESLKQRRRLERYQSLEMQRQREARVAQSMRHELRKEAERMLNRTWMCDRFECNKRVFYSEFRYNTHMKLHRLKDKDGYKSREELYRLKQLRKKGEEEFLARVRALRDGLINIRGCDDIESCNPLVKAHVWPECRKYLTKLPPLSVKDAIPRSIGKLMVAPSAHDIPEDYIICGDCIHDERSVVSTDIIQSTADSREGVAIEDDNCEPKLVEALYDNATDDESKSSFVSNLSTAQSTDSGPNTANKSSMNVTGDVSAPPPVPVSPPGPYAKRKVHLAPSSSDVPVFSPIRSHDGKHESLLETSLREGLMEPPWMHMPQLVSLSETVQSSHKMYFEVVSKVDEISVSRSKYVLNKHVFRIGALESCDCTLRCEDTGGDIRYVRRASRIHCLVYVPLVLPQYNQSSRHSKHPPLPPDSQPSAHGITGDDNEEGDDEPALHKNVTIVDNHSMWGTYIVSENGVKKVPTVIQKGIPLVPGDLVCIGVVRNGPETMSPIEANKALIVFRVRVE
mmetsp:Transcript_16206/g.24415  ORF Transcript_16206/g.24415 Transcript_16206/m.24415 type:complete len:910 (+) Transcript_16206:48-2777(+)